MISLLGRFYRQQREFVLYCFIGVTGVALDFGIFLALTGWGLSPDLATAISVSVGILNNFVWNAWLNFQIRDRYIVRFISFYAVGMIGVVLSVAIIVIGGHLGWTPLWSKIVSIPVVVITQFTMNKVITFRTSRMEPNAPVQSTKPEIEEHA